MSENTGGWPRCARCKKPVEQLLRVYIPHKDEHQFTALCHGEKETTIVDAAALAFADGVSLSGPAFVTSAPQLPP